VFLYVYEISSNVFLYVDATRVCQIRSNSLCVSLPATELKLVLVSVGHFLGISKSMFYYVCGFNHISSLFVV